MYVVQTLSKTLKLLSKNVYNYFNTTNIQNLCTKHRNEHSTIAHYNLESYIYVSCMQRMQHLQIHIDI